MEEGCTNYVPQPTSHTQCRASVKSTEALVAAVEAAREEIAQSDFFRHDLQISAKILDEKRLTDISSAGSLGGACRKRRKTSTRPQAAMRRLCGRVLRRCSFMASVRFRCLPCPYAVEPSVEHGCSLITSPHSSANSYTQEL